MKTSTYYKAGKLYRVSTFEAIGDKVVSFAFYSGLLFFAGIVIRFIFSV